MTLSFAPDAIETWPLAKLAEDDGEEGGAGGSVPPVTITVHAVYLPRPRIEISGPQGVQATFDWQAARDSVVGRMCTATLVNDVETY